MLFSYSKGDHTFSGCVVWIEFGIVYSGDGSDSVEEGAYIDDQVEDISVENKLLAKFLLVFSMM